ncbi:DUF171-domain-containing protein [Aspergillus campestris IBT 28561]|uniref:DUF171-domain-containing protein n=1 Tax=Aspergillus campestris (strain IBT 28561) TaxID=1392248 RepID=A0A2I1D8A3_ASPC2|nr:DUF171-domain-containing protein [Aspergillus campestris IBT 28561]PKY06111.1 DUF171-domain-containing protein [Aspergillus campestris IBT 28561]
MRRPQVKKQKTFHENGDIPLHTAKPTVLFTPKGGRTHTLSIALPGSIVANAHSPEQKTLLAGTIARALAVFCVDEVVIFDDDEGALRRNRNHPDHEDYDPIAKTSDELNAPGKGYTAYSDPSHFLAHLLSYLETPPYLRKHLFPMHPNLRTAGLLPSLDMPHHLRANEWCDYREGIVVGELHQQDDYHPYGQNQYPRQRRCSSQSIQSDDSNTTVIDTGLSEKVVVPNIQLPEHARVTVRFSQPGAPLAEPCPFDGGYDLSFGTSERGAPVAAVLEDEEGDPRERPPDFGHMLVVFGGVAGIENAVRNDPQLRNMAVRPSEAGKLFDYYVNLLPGQGSRTIRTEEAVWLGLTSLRGVADGTQRPKESYRYNGA